MDANLPTFLLPAIVAFQAILLGIFGTLLNVYNTYVGRGAPIVKVIRYLCYFHSAVLIIAMIIGEYAIYLLYNAQLLPVWISILLAIILIHSPLVAAVLVVGMWLDAS